MLTGAKPINLVEAEETAEESSNSTQGLDSFIQDSVSLSQNEDLLQRKFLWGDTKERKKLHLIGWDKLTRKKKYGSLGIKRLMEQNNALLAKWWWRFNKEKEALWVKVVSSKYDLCEGAWLPHLPNKRKASNLWKVIYVQ